MTTESVQSLDTGEGSTAMSTKAFETEGMTWQELVIWAEANDTHISGTYTLTARREGVTEIKVLSGCGDDTEATFRGMTFILNTAAKEQGSAVKVWSKGRIELRDPDGEIVQTMDEKP